MSFKRSRVLKYSSLSVLVLLLVVLLPDDHLNGRRVPPGDAVSRRDDETLGDERAGAEGFEAFCMEE